MLFIVPKIKSIIILGSSVRDSFRDAIRKVERFDDRLMKQNVILGERTIHFITGYALQAGCPGAENDAFWQLLDGKTCNLPADDYKRLNGHVGEKADGNRCHGGKGFRECNEGGERIVDFEDSNDLALVDKWFIKRLSYLFIVGTIKRKSHKTSTFHHRQ